MIKKKKKKKGWGVAVGSEADLQEGQLGQQAGKAKVDDSTHGCGTTANNLSNYNAAFLCLPGAQTTFPCFKFDGAVVVDRGANLKYSVLFAAAHCCTERSSLRCHHLMCVLTASPVLALALD